MRLDVELRRKLGQELYKERILQDIDIAQVVNDTGLSRRLVNTLEKADFVTEWNDYTLLLLYYGKEVKIIWRYKDEADI